MQLSSNYERPGKEDPKRGPHRHPGWCEPAKLTCSSTIPETFPDAGVPGGKYDACTVVSSAALISVGVITRAAAVAKAASGWGRWAS